MLLARPHSRIRHVPGTMNRTERAYAAHLTARMAAGEVLRFSFERWKCQLADRTWFTPDFQVITPECVEFHEVKARWMVKAKGQSQRVSRAGWQEDARVKWKVAAEENPWARWISVSPGAAGWVIEEYGAGGAACRG